MECRRINFGRRAIWPIQVALCRGNLDAQRRRALCDGCTAAPRRPAWSRACCPHRLAAAAVPDVQRQPRILLIATGYNYWLSPFLNGGGVPLILLKQTYAVDTI
eukprot:SAG11_NODE_948_length_6409_cov_7.859113_4_plen_104_part_00